MSMSRITNQGDQFGSTDLLDGIPLKNDERLILEWPDGFLEQVAVKVDGTETYFNRYLSAYVLTTVRGALVKVPIAGFNAQRVL